MANESLPDRVWNYLSSLHVSKERAEEVIRIVSDGSVPHLGYYALISAATVIASLGLIQNSAAVVIGAMLVSPLMTPIFGMATGIVRGDTPLFFKALRAEFGGVALAVLFGMVFGAMPLLTGLTPEISARLKPNLLDLLVAVFAGLAGTWAMVDERISPVLPGVAISTAIIPPLAVCGICLSQGAFTGAQGAFLLFFANFLAVLLVSSLVFWRVGLGAESMKDSRKQVMRPIYVTGVCLLVVAALLTQALLNMLELRRRTEIARNVLTKSAGTHPIFSIIGLEHQESSGKVEVLATLRTSRALSPDTIAQFEKQMSERMLRPVRLTASCMISHKIASTGSTDISAGRDLDGLTVDAPVHPDVRVVRVAEQTLREALKGLPDLWVIDVDMSRTERRTLIIATVQSHRKFLPEEVKAIEDAINQRLNGPNIALVMRCQIPYDVTSHGRILLGDRPFNPDNADEEKILRFIHRSVRNLGNLFVTNMDGVRREDYWEVYAEIQGERVITRSEVKQVEEEVSAALKHPVKLRAWSRAELVVTDSGNFTTTRFIRDQIGKTKYGLIQENLRSLTKKDPKRE